MNTNQIFDINNFQIGKNYVIEASAGTGKTYNIVEIVKKLLSNNYKLNELLIVTYTDKAAGELKDRIRKENSNEDVDNASIYTIHSFCESTIKEFGISANLPLNLNVIGDNELKTFAEKYVREGDILTDIISFMTNEKVEFDTISQMFVDAINKYYLDFDGNEVPSIIELENLDPTYNEINELFADCKKAKTIEDLFDKYPDIKTNLDILKNVNYKEGKNFYQEMLKNFKENFNFNGTTYKEPKRFIDGIASDEIVQALEYFKSIKNSLKEVDIKSYLISTYLKDFYLKWQKEKEINKNQTFNDMLRYVRERILDKNSSLTNLLRKKYRMGIIDEFQDTNQIQFDIFKNIFLCEGHNIIVVGDPKQSIYSFQGADVQVYYQAKNAIVEKNGGICSDLQKNYRSTEAMVNSCNKLFKYYDFAGTVFTPCDSLKTGVDEKYHDVKYENAPTKAFWIADNVTKYEFAKIAVQQIVDFCSVDKNNKTKLQIKDKDDTEFRNIKFQDFAVLARTRTEMSIIENELKQAGIPFIRYKDKSLYLGKESKDWLTIFQAINTTDLTGKNYLKFKKILFTSFFNYSLNQINNSNFDKEDCTEMLLLKKWKQLAIDRKWEDLIDDIIVSSNIIERLNSLNNIQKLGKYKQIGNYCIEYLSNNHTIGDLIRNLETISSGISSDESEDIQIVEKTTNLNCVQIMTMHASKGLQFPVVISVGGFKEDNKNNIIKTYHYIEKDDNENVISSHHYLTAKSNNQYKTIIKDEIIEEWKRLFYVGYTRGQFIVILPNYAKGNKFATFLKETITTYMKENPNDYINIISKNIESVNLRNDVSKILSSANTIELLASSNEVDQEKSLQDNILKELIKLKPQKLTNKHSYSSIAHPKDTPEIYEDDDEETNTSKLSEYDKNSIQINSSVDSSLNQDILTASYPRGAATGTALHEIFEKIDFTNYNSYLRDIIIKSFNKQNLKLDDNQLDLTVNMVHQVLHADFPIIKGNKSVAGNFKLSTIPLSDKRAEMEFNFNLCNQKLKNYCNGFIDLLFRRGDSYCILDWKSDSLSDEFTSYSDNSQLKKHVDETYSIQRVLYSYCLIKWLKEQYKSLSEDEIFEKHFGGIYYVFIRGTKENTGNGIYAQTWSSWNDLQQAFDHIINNRIIGDSND